MSCGVIGLLCPKFFQNQKSTEVGNSRTTPKNQDELYSPTGFGYVNNCGKNDSKIFERSYNAVQDWLITSRQTVPDTSSIFGW